MGKYKFLKISAVSAVTLTGIAALTNTRPVNASTYKNALKRIKISYLSGYGIKIWTSYDNGSYTGMRAHDGTTWNVMRSIVDKKGRLWYQLGPGQWVLARYTIDLPLKKASTKKVKRVKRASTIVKETKKRIKKAKKKKATKPASTVKTKKNKGKKPVSQAPKLPSKHKKVKSVLNAITRLAKQQVGKAYTWGGNGPSAQDKVGSFDCSGLVCYVYAHAAGKSLPRTTYDQVKVGKTVSMNQLKPGDLLFWGSTTAPYHVAIYIGNNQYVNAATPQQGVVLQTLSNYFYPSIAKRIL